MSVKKLCHGVNTEHKVLAMRVRFIYILVVRVAVFVTFCCQKVSKKKF